MTKKLKLITNPLPLENCAVTYHQTLKEIPGFMVPENLAGGKTQKILKNCKFYSKKLLHFLILKN